MKKTVLLIIITGLFLACEVSSQVPDNAFRTQTYSGARPDLVLSPQYNSYEAGVQVFQAGENGKSNWTTNGPFGGSVFSFAIDSINDIIYAGTRNGLWKSNDGGANWEISLALEDVVWGWGMINSISILPNNPDIIYAAALGGFYKTSDAGTSWISIDYVGGGFSCVEALYHNGNEMVFKTGNDAVMKSNDGGLSWVNIASSNMHPSGPLVVNPNNPDIIYVGTNVNGVYKTITGSSNWVQLGNGIPTGLNVAALKQNPANPNTLYAIMNKRLPDQIGLEGLYKSYDAGASWVLMDSTITQSSIEWVCRLYTYDMLAIDPLDTNNIYVTDRNKILRSTDGGESFNAFLYSENPWECFSVIVDNVNSQTVYTGLFLDGILKSADAGANWSYSNYGMLGVASPTEVVLHPSNPEAIYVGGHGGYEGGGIFKSNDSGLNWQTINNGLTNLGKSVKCLAVNPNNPEMMYASTSGGLFTSMDSGNTWTQNTNLPLDNIIIHPINSSIIYATIGNEVYKTEDGGTNWSQIATVGGGWDGPIQDMVMDPSNPEILYTGNQMFYGNDDFGGIFQSIDSGLSWTKLKNQAVIEIAIDPQNSMVIYYGTCKHGLYKSSDCGNSWDQINTGLGSGTELPYIGDIVIDPANTNNIYVGLQNSFYSNQPGVQNNGVYQSIDGGLTWEAMPMEGLIWKDIDGLILDTSNSKLYASVDYGGVYTYDIVTGIDDNKFPVPAVHSLSQNYPNPFNYTTTIKFTTMDSDKNTKIIIFSFTGQKIKTLVNKKLNTGIYQVVWDGTDDWDKPVSSGIYFYKLQNNNLNETKRMVLLR